MTLAAGFGAFLPWMVVMVASQCLTAAVTRVLCNLLVNVFHFWAFGLGPSRPAGLALTAASSCDLVVVLDDEGRAEAGVVSVGVVAVTVVGRLVVAVTAPERRVHSKAVEGRF